MKLKLLFVVPLLTASVFAEQVIDQRVDNQQRRILNGLNQGQLTPEQATRMLRKNQAIQQQVDTQAVDNGGTLTQPERTELKNELNQQSDRIYDKRHN